VRIAIGSQFFPAEGDAGRRQQRARAALLALDDVCRVNLQFADEDFRAAGFETRPVLVRDSRTVTGGEGRRKPIVSEMFDALAAAAREHGCRYFAYLNADIEVTPAAIDRVGGGLDGYAFCRMDLDPATRAPAGVERSGLDMFAIDVDWWARERHRFRPYIAGEMCWDNVYAAIICAHGRGDIVDEAPGIFHERHLGAWSEGLFAYYNGYLAALDARYFSQWTVYAARRAAAGTGADRGALIGGVFDGRPLSRLAAARQAVRAARAAWKYARLARAHRAPGDRHARTRGQDP
jgi:hypothetical protein